MTHKKHSWATKSWSRKGNGDETAAFENPGHSMEWGETALPPSSAWDAARYDPSFFDENEKVYKWDDSGAMESLLKFQSNVEIGLVPTMDDFQREHKIYSQNVDHEARRTCTLESCAEELPTPLVRRAEYSGVILGLPQRKEDHHCFNTSVATPLPADYVPEPTGWGESDESPAASRLEAVQMQEAGSSEVDVQDSSRELFHPADSAEGTWGTGRPEHPDSYQHIKPTGWGDVPCESNVGWKNATSDPPSVPTEWGAVLGDSHMVLETTTRPSQPWRHLPSLVEKRWDTHLSTRSRKQHGNGRTKRDVNGYESVGRKSIQKAGKAAGNVYRGAYDSRPCRPRFQRVNFGEQAPALTPQGGGSHIWSRVA